MCQPPCTIIKTLMLASGHPGGQTHSWWAARRQPKTPRSSISKKISSLSTYSFLSTRLPHPTLGRCGRTVRNNTLSDAFVFHQTLSASKVSYIGQFRQAYPKRELENPYFFIRIINKRIKLTTFLTISYITLLPHQSI